MNLRMILNPAEEPRAELTRGESGGPSALERPSSSTTSSSRNTIFTGFQRQESLPSLIPLASALPPLSRTTSDYSEPAASPITPDYTPDRTPNLSFERGNKRHYTFGSQRPQLNPHQRHHPPRSHPYSSRSAMDPFNMALAGEYQEDLGLMSYAPPLLQDMSHMQMNPIPQQPLPAFPQDVPLAPMAPMHQQAVPVKAHQAPVKPQRKNSYPCPVSKQYGCSEHFTTSGHAARHAKKHTGKKDAICPECQKAFTRKDNMEQHRRTHAPGRTSSKSSPEESRQRKAMKLQQQKKSTIKTPDLPQIEPDLPMLRMPSTIIDAQNLLTSNAPQLGMLDPQLQSSPMQSPFAEDMTSIAMGYQPQPFYSLNDMTPIAPMSNMMRDPILTRDGPVMPLQDQMQVMPNMSSPSTTSSSSKHDTPLSPGLSLDALADAAASRLQ